MQPLPTTTAPLRWGILSTARIIRRNWSAMRESGAATLVALASRDLAKADAFIDEMQAESPWPVRPAAHGSYESLLANPEVEAVYIPLPTGVRKEWVIRAAEAGKHVLCEKPCAVSAADLREMVACCELHGVRFMDGVMFMHDPRFSRLREMLDDGETFGEVRRISSVFSFRGGDDFASADIRGQAGLEPMGCLGDLGWYCLRASLWVMKWELPQRVCGRVLVSENAAIMEFSGELDFSNGATASFYCSFLTPNQRWLNVSGTTGNLRVPDFVVPADDNDIDYEIGFHRVVRSPAAASVSTAARMFACFAAEVRNEITDTRWPEISLKNQLLLDACELSSRLGCAVVLEGDSYRAER